ncbi:MAG: hypothetical protein HY519_01960 [Candidatus Aenigmarchaeota archaeon]|nr:hypothetical protein [Candidatus Aenigmarchaeota archaeon]
MKLAIILALLALAAAYSAAHYLPPGPAVGTASTISGTQELALSEQDLRQLGMASATGCRTEVYSTGEYAPLMQYSFCNYTINSLNGTEVVLELKKFANSEDLNGTYQYESLHLRGFQGLISENDYGDLSRFYANNESAVYYYHLWIGKNEFLIHITSKGDAQAGGYIAETGRKILAKFG